MQKTPYALISPFMPNCPLCQEFITLDDYFLERDSKLPTPLIQESALHHFYFMLHTEYHWTAHTSEYSPLERQIMHKIMEHLTKFCPILKHLHENPINTPNILFTS